MEKERAKKDRKKERKHQEKADRDTAKEFAGGSGEASPLPVEHTESDATGPRPSQSGNATPELAISPAVGNAGDHRLEESILSPGTESTGARTPTGRKPARNPWTIFMRLQESAGEGEIREYFLEGKIGVRIVLLSCT